MSRISFRQACLCSLSNIMNIYLNTDTCYQTLYQVLLHSIKYNQLILLGHASQRFPNTSPQTSCTRITWRTFYKIVTMTMMMTSWVHPVPQNSGSTCLERNEVLWILKFPRDFKYTAEFGHHCSPAMSVDSLSPPTGRFYCCCVNWDCWL